MKKLMSLCIGVLLVQGIFFLNGKTFFRFQDDADIPSWGIESVEYLKDENIMTGFADGTFRPHTTLNRVEALAILLRTKGINYNERVLDTPIYFSDIANDQWYTKIVQNGVHEGWIKGFPDGTFRPGDPVNRVEWAVMIQRAFEMTRQRNPGFQDVPEDVWFSEAVFSLAANDLIRNERAVFEPSSPVSRVDAAWIITKIKHMPRLMGESQEMDFSNALQRNARTIAIKPRNFNPNDQGYDIEPKNLLITPSKKAEKQLVRRTDDWVPVGEFRIKNTFERKARFDMIEIKMRFDASNMGPVDNFLFRMEDSVTGFVREGEFNTSGSLFFGGMDFWMEPGTETLFSISLNPQSDRYYFGASGEAILYAYKAEGMVYTEFVSDKKESSGFVPASVKLEDGYMGHIEFLPKE